MATSIEFRADGSLDNLADWNEQVAQVMALREGIALGPAHREVIRLMREYYAEYNTPPIRKLLKKLLAERLGKDRSTDAWLAELFPGDVLRQGCRIAGLPYPELDAEIERHSAPAPVRTTQEPKHFQDRFEFEGRSYRVHEKGNLVDLADWSERVADFMARKEGILLTEEHWAVLRFLRKFYFEYGIAPMVKLLMKHLDDELGPEKSDRDYLYRLFPGGPSRQGSRIAGLPEPQGCIDD